MGSVLENLSGRKAEITQMDHHGNDVTIEALIPMRGLIGFETDLVNATRGLGVMSHLFHEYGPHRGEIAARKNGSLVSMEDGEAMAYALNMVQERGRLMVEPGDKIYKGMIVGENARENDIPVNPCKAKRLTNMRSTGDGKGIQLDPPSKCPSNGRSRHRPGRIRRSDSPQPADAEKNPGRNHPPAHGKAVGVKPFSFKDIAGSITAPQGFRAAGVFCDIKRLGTGKGSDQRPKTGPGLLIVSDAPATVAGTFTTNHVCAAPVKLCVKRVARGTARAIVANSGNANACTGQQGLRDARDMARAVADACRSDQFPRAKSWSLPPAASASRCRCPKSRKGYSTPRGSSLPRPDAAAHSAEAIMTSDTRPKEIAVEFELGGQNVRLGGICKGAGMIQPGMSPSGARARLAAVARHHALFSDHRRRRGAKHLQAAAERGRRQEFQPHHRGRRHEHQRHRADPGQRARRQPAARPRAVV